MPKLSIPKISRKTQPESTDEVEIKNGHPDPLIYIINSLINPELQEKFIEYLQKRTRDHVDISLYENFLEDGDYILADINLMIIIKIHGKIYFIPNTPISSLLKKVAVPDLQIVRDLFVKVLSADHSNDKDTKVKDSKDIVSELFDAQDVSEKFQLKTILLKLTKQLIIPEKQDEIFSTLSELFEPGEYISSNNKHILFRNDSKLFYLPSGPIDKSHLTKEEMDLLKSLKIKDSESFINTLTGTKVNPHTSLFLNKRGISSSKIQTIFRLISSSIK